MDYFQHTAVNTVFEHNDNLIKYFEHNRDTKAVDQVLLSKLQVVKDPKFISWLIFYQTIMLHVAFFVVWLRPGDKYYCNKITDLVKHFANAVANIRNAYEYSEASAISTLHNWQNYN